jgi:hypothetical protein
MGAQLVWPRCLRLDDFIVAAQPPSSGGLTVSANPSLSSHLDENGVEALGLKGLTKNFNYPEITFGGSYLVNYPTLGFQDNDFGAGQNFQGITHCPGSRIGIPFEWARTGAGRT